MLSKIYAAVFLLLSSRAFAFVPCEARLTIASLQSAPILFELGNRAHSTAWQKTLELIQMNQPPAVASFEKAGYGRGASAFDSVIFRGTRYRIPSFILETVVRSAIHEVLVIEGAGGSLAFIPVSHREFTLRPTRWHPTGMDVWFYDGETQKIHHQWLFEDVEQRNILALSPLTSTSIFAEIASRDIPEGGGFRMQYDSQGAFVRSFSLQAQTGRRRVRIGMDQTESTLVEKWIPARAHLATAEIVLGRPGLFANELKFKALKEHALYHAMIKIAELEFGGDLSTEIVLLSNGAERRLALSFVFAPTAPADSLTRQSMIRKALFGLGLSYPSLMNQNDLGLEELASGGLILLDSF